MRKYRMKKTQKLPKKNMRHLLAKFFLIFSVCWVGVARVEVICTASPRPAKRPFRCRSELVWCVFRERIRSALLCQGWCDLCVSGRLDHTGWLWRGLVGDSGKDFFGIVK